MEIMRKPEVCIIILTYNTISKLGPSFLSEVLRSLFNQTYENLRLTIVDNASSDNTVEFVTEHIKRHKPKYRCRVIRLDRNYGWSGGNNRGAILCIDSDFLFFMNDDTILDESCIYRLLNILMRNKELGAVQPLIVNRDGSINCGFEAGLAGFMEMVSSLKGRLFRVFYTQGAAFLTKAKHFFEVGMFDEDLFLTHDDFDYCYRLRLAGYDVACVSEARAYHYGGATLGSENPILWYYVVRNNLWVLAKNTEAKYLLFKLILALAETFVSWFWYALYRLKDLRRAANVIKGVLDGIGGCPLALSKRHRINEIRKVRDSELHKSISIEIDIERLMPFLRCMLRNCRRR